MKNITILLSLLTCSFCLGQASANYDIMVTTIWNVTDHTSVPGNAHWSPFIGASHENINEVLEFGAVAPMSNGIKSIAETGSTTNFENEINSNPNALLIPKQSFFPFAGDNSVATMSGVEIFEQFPYVTLVSMVAPSPDWFIAVNSVNLRSGNPLVNNGWKDTFTIDAFAYDAGTDSGTDYGSGNSITTPRAVITMVSGAPINGNRMATITFTYKSSTLSSENTKTIENIKIFPNPSKGKITLSNLENIELESAKIYSVLGKLIKDITIQNNLTEIAVDLSNLNKGVYLLNLKSAEKNTTKKLVIN